MIALWSHSYLELLVVTQLKSLLFLVCSDLSLPEIRLNAVVGTFSKQTLFVWRQPLLRRVDAAIEVKLGSVR